MSWKQMYPKTVVMYDYCHDCFISALGKEEKESKLSGES